MPLTDEQYFPVRNDPVDRWFQAKNASNPHTTAQFIEQVFPGRPGLVVDPFCGSGSTASAARLMGLPFYGIEADPVLACVSLAKTWGSKWQAGRLSDVPTGPPREQRLAAALDRIRRTCGSDDLPVLSAMAVLSAFREAEGVQLHAKAMAKDLERWPDPVPTGAVTRGDALSTASWRRLGLPRTDAVMYTSPPFGPTSPVISPPGYVRTAAEEVLADCGLDTLGRASPRFLGYHEMVIGMFRRAVERLTSGILIVEHEPDDENNDSTAAVAEAVVAEFAGVIHSPRMIRCGAFSERGILDLLIFDLR